MSEFVAAIREHDALGYIISAYIIEPQSKRNYTIVQRATVSDIENYPDYFSEAEKQIIRIIESYSDQNLMRVFAKKKVSQLEFLKILNKSKLSEQIRPFLEKRMFKIYELIRDNGIKLMYKTAKYESFFADDLFNIHPEPAKTIFNISRSKDEIRYRLSLSHSGEEINLTDRGGFILCNDPCLVVLSSNIYHFDDTDGKKLTPFFSKEFLSIPKSAEKKWFKSFAAKAVKNYVVNPEGFDIDEIKLDCKVKLFLEEDWKNHFSFRAEFHYGKHFFKFGDAQTNKVLFDDENIAFKKLTRNPEQEKKFIQILKSLGLKRFDASNFKLPQKFENETLQKHTSLEWTSENIGTLKQNNIELIQDFHNKIFLTQIPKLDFSVKEKKDWFDIKAVAIFGEFKIPFIELKDYIINQEREYELPDGTTALIPEEWFSRYSDILELSKKQKEHLQLSKHHFSILLKSKIESPDISYFQNLVLLTKNKLPEIPVPKDIRASLRPYQKTGYSRMYHLQTAGLGMCLADDMGLGKTLQTICLLQKIKDERKPASTKISQSSHKPDINKAEQLSIFDSPTTQQETETSNERKPSLIIMPVSLIHNWRNEIRKFSPFLKVLQYHGSNRFNKLKSFSNYDVILTGYGVVRNDIEELEKQHFLYTILDESQYIKNPDSQIYKAVIRLQSDNRLVLTGTPIENSLSDLWAQMNFINPGLLGSRAFFKQNMQIPVEKEHSEQHATKVKMLTNPFILRRTKTEVEKDLPPITEQVIYCDMSAEQKKIYEQEKSKIRNELIEAQTTQEIVHNPVRVIQALSKLRQIANHPQLTDSEYDEDSGKFSEMLRAIENVCAENHKVLIFSSFVKQLKLFCKVFDKKNIQYSLLTGQTKNREQVIKDFQEKPENKIFLISLKAGGTGLNLTAADYVFISDPWWNPAAEKQAVSRAHRIGQDKKVMVYKYISRHTVEEKILKLQAGKQRLSDEIITGENLLKFTDEATIKNLFE